MISEKTILSALDHSFIVRLAGTFQGTVICIQNTELFVLQIWLSR